MEMSWQACFFDDRRRAQTLKAWENPLVILKERIDFEMFRPLLTKAVEKIQRQSPVGRKRLDVVLMFKILILQSLYQLSDEQMEYQINDRYSFGEFLGLAGSANIPDDTTIWKYRELLTKQGVIKEAFF
jgi:hypothetical protein